MQEIDKIKYSDLFEGNPFSEAQKNVQNFIDSINGFQEANRKLAKELQSTLKIAASTNVEELQKLERLLKVSAQLAKQNDKAEKEKQKVIKETANVEKETVKKTKEAVELTFEQLVALEKQKLEKAEIAKQAKEQAKQELGLVKSANAQNSAYKELSDKLNSLRKVYKDLAAEAKKLELAGENPERIEELRLEIAKLQPEIEELDKSLKEIDGSVGQFQRNVGDYKNAIVEAFDEVKDKLKESPTLIGRIGNAFKKFGGFAVEVFNEVKGKINDNVNGLIGLDSRFDSLSDTVGSAKNAFSGFNDEIKKSPTFIGKLGTAFNNLGSLLKNLVKAGGVGLILIALTNLQAVAQKVGGVFNNLRDSTAGVGAVLELFTGKVVKLVEGLGALITLDFAKFKDDLSQVLKGNIQAVNDLAKEISKLNREFEILTQDAGNNYGNFASDVETANQAASNAFLDDAKRFEEAKKAFEIQKQDLELRLGILKQQQVIQEKTLVLEAEITNANQATLKAIREGKVAGEERTKAILSLPNSVQKALLNLEGTLGDIEVLNEDIDRKQVEFTNFLLERSLKNTELVVKSNLNVIKKLYDTEFKTISPELPFDVALQKTGDLAQRLENQLGGLLDEFLKQAGVNLTEFNGLNAIAIQDADELNEKLKSLGVGEAYRVPIVDVWKDGQNEILKYKDLLDVYVDALNSNVVGAEKSIRDARKGFDEFTANQRLQEAQLELSLGNGIKAYDNFRKAQEEVFDLRERNIKELNNELLLLAKSPAEAQAIFENSSNQLEQLANERRNFRAQAEAENLRRVKMLQMEINETIRQRNELEINQKLDKARKNIIFTLDRAKKLQNDLLDIQVDRLILERDELLKFAQTEEERIKIFESFEQKRLKLAEENALKLKEINKQYINEVIDFGQKVISEAQNQLSENFAKQTANIEAQITQLNSAIERERELANQGIASNVDALEKQVAEFEAKKREQAKKEQAAQLALAFINSVASYAKDDPESAVPKAFKDILLTKVLASVISGAFAEGVEGFEGRGTETSDSNLVLISKGESVITAKGTKKYAGLASAMNDGKVEQWVENNYSMQNSLNIEVDQLGNLITKKVSEAGRKIVRSISQRPRL